MVFYAQTPREIILYEPVDIKIAILYEIITKPSWKEKHFLLQALNDKHQEIRLLTAKGLWKLGDKTGLEVILKDTTKRLTFDEGHVLQITQYLL